MFAANMNDDDNLTLESKCRFLQQQLSILGYEQVFTVESLPLLENLVTDLLQTTDTLKHYKELSQGCLQVSFQTLLLKCLSLSVLLKSNQ